MQPVLFDSSIYITALRIADDAAPSLRRIAGGEPVWLSSVVLEELYEGVTVRNRHVVERLERDFDRAGRILVPNLSDWTQTGKVLARSPGRKVRLRENRKGAIDQRRAGCDERGPLGNNRDNCQRA
jgi:predicted nucleic acid-binding protein